MDISPSKKSVTTADGKSHRVDAIGSSSVSTSFGSINLSNILYVPALHRNLISVDALNRHRTYKKCLVFDNGSNKTVIAVGNWDSSNRLYIFCNKQMEALINTVTVEANIKL